MKTKLLFIIALGFLSANISAHQLVVPEVTTTQSEASSSAYVSSITTIHNQKNSKGEFGVTIKVTFTVENMIGRKGYCGAFFYFQGAQQMLKDYDNNYASSNGQVAVTGSFVPNYSATEFTDFELFIPYSQLHLGSGKHNVCFAVSIFDGTRQLCVSQFVNMQITN